ncbi:MAG: hypothetical protein NTW42_02370 [Deltaproteobacteria bacterium]|nr:hypothetical protein [Deltaproteobacteria bacterium]
MRLINQKLHAPPIENKNIPRPATAVRLFGGQASLRLPVTAAILGSERGVALVMALILGLVGMLMIGSLLYMAGTALWTTGSKARYQTALEAAYGGMTFFAREIIQKGVEGTLLSTMGTYGGVLTPLISDANFTAKLTTPGSVGIGGYPADNPDAILTLTFLAPTPTVTMNATISTTTRGNSGTSSNVLVGGGVVNNSSGPVPPQHIPYMYHTVIQARNLGATQESATLSSLYAY